MFIKFQFTNPNKKEFNFYEKAIIKTLLIYEMPKEYRKQVNTYNIIYLIHFYFRYGLQQIK